MRSLLALVVAVAFAAATPAADEPGAALFKLVKEKVGDGKPFSLGVVATLKPGSGEKFEAIAAKVAAATRKEKGNQQYEFFRAADTADTYYLFEKWSDLKSLEAHFAADHLKEFLKEFGELAAGPPAIKVGIPLAK